MQIKQSSKEYDVIIVGSGAGGGMATKVLSEAGLSVAVVEAGPYYDPANPEQMTQLKPAYHSPRRGAGTTRFLVIMTKLTEVGILMENLTVKMTILILDGLDLECLEEEQITGEGFL